MLFSQMRRILDILEVTASMETNWVRTIAIFVGLSTAELMETQTLWIGKKKSLALTRQTAPNSCFFCLHEQAAWESTWRLRTQ